MRRRSRPGHRRALRQGRTHRPHGPYQRADGAGHTERDRGRAPGAGRPARQGRRPGGDRLAGRAGEGVATARMELSAMAANSDTLPTATRVADPGRRALYRWENRWQAWLDVEAALARAQAELGIIPADAAEAIAAKARLERMGRGRGDERCARPGHPPRP